MSSRVEELLAAAIDGSGTDGLDPPQSRNEKLLFALNNKLNNVQSDISKLSEEKVSQADLGEGNVVSFKNSAGLVLFTLDLSGLGTPATYGNLVLSVESLTVEEGGEGTFTVALDSAPSANQIVYLAVSDNTRLSVSPATLTFAPENWETPQVVTITALQDDDKDDNSITVTLTSKKVDSKQVTVLVADDDISVSTDGLTAYWNLRNGDLTDSVGGIASTNGGTTVDGGLYLESASTKWAMAYPLKTANIPNGCTIEMALTGVADLQAAGNGYGTGYAFRALLYTSYVAYGFAYYANGSLITDNPIGTGNVAGAKFFSDFDWTTEHTIAFVFNPNGSAGVYIDGVLNAYREVPDGFENYNVSGTLSFKIPYMGTGNIKIYPITLSEFRIYERALSDEEIVNNHKADVSHQNAVNF